MRPHPRRHPQAAEARSAGDVVFGVRATLAVFEHRRDDLVEVLHSREVADAFAPVTQWAATRKIPCRVVGAADLARVAGTQLHEGACARTRERIWRNPDDLARRLVTSGGAAVALDRVRNAYNVGSMIRTAAFFGLDAMILGALAPHPALPPDAVRVAEGGAERLHFARTTDLAATLARLRTKGIRIVGTDSRAQQSVFEWQPPKACVLVVGHERDGLSPRVREQCDAVVAIPGSGEIDSLNVAVASAILISQWVARVGPASGTLPRP